MKNIQRKKDLKTLYKRYKDTPCKDEQVKDYWLKVIQGCIDSQSTEEPFGMDETDYELTPNCFKNCWEGLR